MTWLLDNSLWLIGLSFAIGWSIGALLGRARRAGTSVKDYLYFRGLSYLDQIKLVDLFFLVLTIVGLTVVLSFFLSGKAWSSLIFSAVVATLFLRGVTVRALKFALTR